MTFFNKKTEVMQIEMTPYGRYLYSIGKFKPHSYEFVDDDILYKEAGSTEAQEYSHQRIINETPKLKITRAFQNEAQQVESPPRLDKQRIMTKENNVQQSDLFVLGKSSYSSDRTPAMQVTMLQGKISGSTMFDDLVNIPQIDIDFNFVASLKNELNRFGNDIEAIRTEVFEDGTYVEIKKVDPIIHLKEFNSFYEKENFEIEVFEMTEGGQMLPLKFTKKLSIIVNDLLLDEDQYMNVSPGSNDFFEEGRETPDFVEYYFDLQIDNEIPKEVLCEAVDKLEINSQFLDEELICPDMRTDRFDIYATRVSPEDLEDCK